jgi:hypothetical protein
MNMKTLNVEELSSVAGAEPRGLSPTGRQNDGSDIWGSGAARWKGEDQITVTVGYDDATYGKYRSPVTHNPKAP